MSAWTFELAKGAVAARQDWHCMRCGKNTHGMCDHSTHHRQLRRKADPDVRDCPANLIRLCGSGTTGCHGWVHAHPYEAWRNGWMVPMGMDPLSTPVRDWDGCWRLLDPVSPLTHPVPAMDLLAWQADIERHIEAKKGNLK